MQQPFDKRTLKLIQIYQKARKNLLNVIFNAETSQGTVASFERALLKQVNAELRALNINVQNWSQSTLPGFYMEGVNSVDEFLKENGLPIGSFAKLHKEAIKTIVDNTVTDLLTANKFVGRKINDDLRKIALDVIGQKLTTGKTIEQTKNLLMDSLLNNGLAYIQDDSKKISISNKTYQLDKYAEMVARSTTREATNRGTLNQLTNLGYDLVQMSDHASPCPLCAIYEGRVYSISGNDERFPPLDFAFNGEFANIHPNCEHVLTPYIERFADNPEKDLEISNKTFSDSEYKSKIGNYYEQQAEKRQTNYDTMQYEKYKLVLGDKVGTFDDFLGFKEDLESYKNLKADYRTERANLRKQS